MGIENIEALLADTSSDENFRCDPDESMGLAEESSDPEPETETDEAA